MDPVGVHSTGDAVEDVQRRLRILGYDVKVDGVFGPVTAGAVREFREGEGLVAGEVVDARAWAALVDASFALGDRMLYLRMPYFHGGDVRRLQQILDTMGFACGGADGIFGAHTESALRDFQASVGLVDDGIAGDDAFEAIERLRHAWEGKGPAGADGADGADAAGGPGIGGHVGFARAAEVLERVEACFYGLDATGRGVATRVANLAWATSSSARVTSADAMGSVPEQTLLKVGVCTDGGIAPDGVPVVALREDGTFAQRLAVALSSASPAERRVVVSVPGEGPATADGTVMAGGRWEQHLAVVLLDAFCTALR